MKKTSVDKRWSVSNSSVYNLGYHIIWCPKCRRKVLVDGVDIELKRLIKEKCDEREWGLENVEVMEDHVHIFVKCRPTDSVAYIVAQLKGYTSHELKKLFPWLNSRLPNLWTRSYYAESIGTINEETIKRYIENQKLKPNSSHR